MDKVDHHHYTSIFKDMKNPLWWNSDQGWKNKYIDRDPSKGRIKWLGGLINKPVQLTDAWHFFKMCMIIFVAMTGVLNLLSPPVLVEVFGNVFVDYLINFTVQLLVYGVIWNTTFTLFYHKIWSKK
jgi:hypothetical protein